MSIYTFIVILVFVAVVGAWVWFLFNRAVVYGWIGELAMRKRYLSRLPKGYIVINDLFFETSDGRTHQVDHVIVSPYGIFVIETKAYMGKIYGDQYSDQWKEYLAGVGYTFYNPLRQNHGHVRGLMKITDLPREAFVPIVVFGRSDQLRMRMHNDDGGKVVHMPELMDTIRSFKKRLIEPETQKRIVKLLKDANITSSTRRRKHAANIRNKYNK